MVLHSISIIYMWALFHYYFDNCPVLQYLAKLALGPRSSTYLCVWCHTWRWGSSGPVEDPWGVVYACISALSVSSLFWQLSKFYLAELARALDHIHSTGIRIIYRWALFYTVSALSTGGHCLIIWQLSSSTWSSWPWPKIICIVSTLSTGGCYGKKSA
jgi:hypothetical protein